MINIFGAEGKYWNVLELTMQCLQEVESFFLHFFILLVILMLVKRLHSKYIATALAFLMPVIQIAYVWSVSIQSELFFSASFAFLLTMQLWILRLFPLRAEEYLFFFSVLLFPNRLFNSTSSILGDLWLFWIIFCVCYVTAKTGLRKLQGSQFNCYLLFVVLSLSAYTFRLAVLFLHQRFADWMGNYAAGLVCTVSLLLLLLIVGTFLLHHKFNRQLAKLNKLGQKYKRIERYFFFFSVLILIMCTLIFLPFTVMGAQNALVLLLFPGLCLTLLLVQLPFILLLYRVAFYKESAAFSHLEKEGLVSYYQSLSQSLTTMQEMRHDIKNIFFTMGNFVNHSDDQEMKAFFWDKIFPYSKDAIKQNELLSAIYQLPSESLQAFFYLKLSQAAQQKLQISLKVHILPERFQIGMDIIDLTRILGILLDNAIEEAQLVPDGILEVRIVEDENCCSYHIKNTVTNETKKRGVHAGTTTKGKGHGHGHGLLILRQLIEQYDFVTLNTYMQNDCYLQSLNLTLNDSFR